MTVAPSMHLMTILLAATVISVNSQGLDRKVGCGDLPIPGLCPRI